VRFGIFAEKGNGSRMQAHATQVREANWDDEIPHAISFPCDSTVSFC
jgi:hypothetical protein